MKMKNTQRDVAYTGKLLVMQGERKVTLSALEKCVRAGEAKEIRFESEEIASLRELHAMIHSMKPPKESKG